VPFGRFVSGTLVVDFICITCNRLCSQIIDDDDDDDDISCSVAQTCIGL